MQLKQSIRSIASSFAQVLTRKTSPYASPSLDLCLDPTVAAVLGEAPALAHPLLPVKSDHYVGWGRKSGEQAARMARSRGKGLLRMEDGFLRSYHRNDPALSVVVDDLGIYYDATGPSRLEALIKQPLTEEQKTRIDKVLGLWRQHGLSKYNAGRDYAGPLPDDYVLVVDQVKHDASIQYGLADEKSFLVMLDKAIKDNPGIPVLVKMHPDIYTRSKMGHFDLTLLSKIPGLMVIAENCLPTRLIRQASKVYTVTSQMGFEALIWGRPVHCMGMPFFAGWGLTEDHLPPPPRRVLVTFEQLAFASLLSYARYVNPIEDEVCNIETVIEVLLNCKQSDASEGA